MQWIKQHEDVSVRKHKKFFTFLPILSLFALTYWITSSISRWKVISSFHFLAFSACLLEKFGSCVQNFTGKRPMKRGCERKHVDAADMFLVARQQACCRSKTTCFTSKEAVASPERTCPSTVKQLVLLLKERWKEVKGQKYLSLSSHHCESTD